MTLKRVHVPVLERLALADLADRRGETEEQALARIIRDAVRRECTSDEILETEEVKHAN